MARKCVGMWRRILISSCLVCFASERGQSLQMEQPPAEEILVAELQVHRRVLALTPEQVAPLIERAIAEDILAQCVLGVAYEGRSTVPKDDAEAIKWLTIAARRGIPWVQKRLGHRYHHGAAVRQDYFEAV